MTNYNQLLINDYKQTIERIQKECTEKTDLNIKLISRIKELEEKLNAQFAEMEEKLTAEENKNFELKEKLKIAEEALTQISKTTLVMKHNGYTYRFEDFFGKTEAQQALKQMEEVK